MFEEGGFEIYESTTKEYVIKDIYEEPDGPSKHMLEVREVLDEIKTKFYELEENTALWEDDDKARISMSWVTMLRKATGPIRQQGVRLALEDLTNSGYDVSNLRPFEAPKASHEHLNDSEEEEG